MFKVRFVPLGGVIGVTKNMYLYELYEDDVLRDIVIVDCGIGFPAEKSLGVDLVIPDISYLQDKLHLVRGLFVTHGHEDHISAIPYHYEALGSPQIYASKLTYHFIKRKCEEVGLVPKLEEISYDREYKAGGFTLQYIHTTHSIPDTTNILIKSPIGNFFHGSDFKMDLTPPFGAPPDFYAMAKAGKEGILCLMTDCLGAERDGMTASERTIGATFESEMRTTRGAFIMTTFSSNISRIRQCVEAAIKMNRKVVFFGRSMHENIRIAKEIGYFPENEKFYISERQIGRTPRNRLCVILAGAQGQFGSALSKLALGENKFFKIQNGDKVVFSSDPIPGNEHEVDYVIEECMEQGADVVHSGIEEEIHTSGHGNRDDLRLLVRLTKPKFILPIGGTVRHQHAYSNLVADMGYGSDKLILLQEGASVVFTPGQYTRDQVIETKEIYVDGGVVGDVGKTILNERRTLSTDGVVIAMCVMHTNGQMVVRPRLVSKGFVFAPTEKQFLQGAISILEKMLRPYPNKPFNEMEFKKEAARALERYFGQKRNRTPLIAVETIYV